MQNRALVFCCKGLGDGLISLTLAHNLQINGYKVTTYHPFLEELSSWFPQLPILPLPSYANDLFHEADKIFFFYEKSKPMEELIQLALSHYVEKTIVLNPIATNNQNYPFWAFGKFTGRIPLVDNLLAFCKFELKLAHIEKSNGIVAPFELKRSEFPQRVAIHPTSSREGKNWPKEKYIKLGIELKKRGFDPFFLLQSFEKESWKEASQMIAEVSSLETISSFIYQSGYFIGNDSGLGHLASSLNIPTITIARSEQSLAFWRPAFFQGKIVTPSSWIPNFKLLRLRDRFWKKWVSLDKVLQAFDSLLSSKS